MRRAVTLLAIAPLAIVWAVLVGYDVANADLVCEEIDRQTGECLVWVEDDTEPPEDPGEDDGPEDSGSGERCFREGTKHGPVPCTSEWGYWSNEHQCYVSVADPQPPADDPVWEGHGPDDGSIYQCARPQPGGTLFWLFWAPEPPPGSEDGPTPREVAELAIDRMGLSAITIGLAPEPDPDSVGLVGMPVWMWADNPDSHTWGPASATASAGGITVTATAQVRKVTWSMGDGTEIVCDTPGTPYEPRFGMRESPDCGHVYQESSAVRPGGTYTVTAVSDWIVTWQGAGQSGVVRLNGLQRSVDIRVGEAQVLVQSRAGG